MAHNISMSLLENPNGFISDYGREILAQYVEYLKTKLKPNLQGYATNMGILRRRQTRLLNMKQWGFCGDIFFPKKWRDGFQKALKWASEQLASSLPPICQLDPIADPIYEPYKKLFPPLDCGRYLPPDVYCPYCLPPPFCRASMPFSPQICRPSPPPRIYSNFKEDTSLFCGEIKG